MGIYKDCDIRGIYGSELKEGDAEKIGRAVATMAGGRNVVVSGDIRNSTPELKDALIRGLLKAGADVIDIGMNPTPVFYYAKKTLDIYAGVQVTASHNPPEYNGFKLMFGDMPVQSKDILAIKAMVKEEAFAKGQGTLTVQTGLWDRYEKEMIHMTGRMRGKVVVDAEMELSPS